MKDKTTAGLLALFLGWLGVHKFYLNQRGLGFLYLGVSIFAQGSWWWRLMLIFVIIDAIRLFTMPTEEFDQEYNRKELLKRRDDEYIKTRRKKKKRHDRPRQERRQQETPRKQPNRKAKRPKDNPYKESGKQKFAEYDYEGAIVDFERAIQIAPDDIALHINAACTYSLLENAEKSFYHIDKAVKYGFTDFEHLTSHDALAFLRVQDGFDEFQKNGFRFVDNQASTEAPPEDKLLDKLNKLQELREKGLLTDDEFAKQKERILRQ